MARASEALVVPLGMPQTTKEGCGQREGPPEYSGKMLGLSIQGIQAEYSVGSENNYFSKVDENNFHKATRS